MRRICIGDLWLEWRGFCAREQLQQHADPQTRGLQHCFQLRCACSSEQQRLPDKHHQLTGHASPELGEYFTQRLNIYSRLLGLFTVRSCESQRTCQCRNIINNTRMLFLVIASLQMSLQSLYRVKRSEEQIFFQHKRFIIYNFHLSHTQCLCATIELTWKGLFERICTSCGDLSQVSALTCIEKPVVTL